MPTRVDQPYRLPSWNLPVQNPHSVSVTSGSVIHFRLDKKIRGFRVDCTSCSRYTSGLTFADPEEVHPGAHSNACNFCRFFQESRHTKQKEKLSGYPQIVELYS